MEDGWGELEAELWEVFYREKRAREDQSEKHSEKKGNRKYFNVRSQTFQTCGARFAPFTLTFRAKKC